MHEEKCEEAATHHGGWGIHLNMTGLTLGTQVPSRQWGSLHSRKAGGLGRSVRVAGPAAREGKAGRDMRKKANKGEKKRKDGHVYIVHGWLTGLLRRMGGNVRCAAPEASLHGCVPAAGCPLGAPSRLVQWGGMRHAAACAAATQRDLRSACVSCVSPFLVMSASSDNAANPKSRFLTLLFP